MRHSASICAIMAMVLLAGAARAQYTFQGIGGKPAPILISVANGISGNGRVVIGGDSVEAAMWTPAGGLVELGAFPGGTTRSNGFAASANGSVLVGDGNGGQEAFRWTAREVNMRRPSAGGRRAWRSGGSCRTGPRWPAPWATLPFSWITGVT